MHGELVALKDFLETEGFTEVSNVEKEQPQLNPQNEVESPLSTLLTDEEKEQPSDPYLSFILDDKIFAISADFVAEVGRPLPITNIPNLPNHFLGIANWRGDIVPVLDLRVFWNKKSSISSNKKMLFLRDVEQNLTLAVLVDQLREIVSLHIPQDNSGVSETYPEISYLQTVVAYKEQNIFVLDATEFLNHIVI